jgi:hypothetical protein
VIRHDVLYRGPPSRFALGRTASAAVDQLVEAADEETPGGHRRLNAVIEHGREGDRHQRREDQEPGRRRGRQRTPV